MPTPPFIELSGIQKAYASGPVRVTALDHIDLTFDKSDFVAITGPSGSGKSTLMHILGCLDRPSSGSYRLDGIDVFAADDRNLSKIRSKHIGFVFQTFNLIPFLNVYENVELPFLYMETDHRFTKQRITDAIGRVGLGHRIAHKPSQLSGGEMQRVAIARAMVIEPAIILADEPTGNLDSRTSEDILNLFVQCNRDGATVVLVTHDPAVADRAHKRIELRDGRLV